MYFTWRADKKYQMRLQICEHNGTVCIPDCRILSPDLWQQGVSFILQRDTDLLLLSAASLPDFFVQDELRPQYHFTPVANWLNDPHGIIYWNGYYHLFYQYYPFGTKLDWKKNHWAHAVSQDLICWYYFPLAIFPEDGTACLIDPV